MENRTVKRALISVYHKEGIETIAKQLNELGVEILSTGGTYDFLTDLGIPVTTVEHITSYPSILGGRVKTLHPKVFGGILARRENTEDLAQLIEYGIPEIDLVIVDLYPFERYVASKAPHREIIEEGKGLTTLEQREYFAMWAFNVSSHYDTAIFKYFNREQKVESFKESQTEATPLRYGENPHQSARFFGPASGIPLQIRGKEISYNNLLDIEAAIELISDFEETTVAILKHNNACGCASRKTVKEAWDAALAADPVSAFGGIIITNREVEETAAEEMNKIFFEVVIAPAYTQKALEILKQKKNRIILTDNGKLTTNTKFRSLLGGVLVQDRDTATEVASSLTTVTNKKPSEKEVTDLIFANKLVKHSKSNAIVLAKDSALVASGIGQTSRVDALKQAITKATGFGMPLQGAVMASDAFFPFPDRKSTRLNSSH